MTGAEAARQVYQRFHSREPNRTLRVNVPEMHDAALIGEVVELKYRAISPSAKGDSVYVHSFGDRGLTDTGAKPLLLTDGTPGVLVIKSKPDEEPFTIDSWLRG